MSMRRNLPRKVVFGWCLLRCGKRLIEDSSGLVANFRCRSLRCADSMLWLVGNEVGGKRKPWTYQRETEQEKRKGNKDGGWVVGRGGTEGGEQVNTCGGR
eukprot:3234543-Rhodomonas_salina.2